MVTITPLTTWLWNKKVPCIGDDFPSPVSLLFSLHFLPLLPTSLSLSSLFSSLLLGSGHLLLDTLAVLPAPPTMERL